MSGHLKSEKSVLLHVLFLMFVFLIVAAHECIGRNTENEYDCFQSSDAFFQFSTVCSPGFLICCWCLFVGFCWMCLLLPCICVQTYVGPRHLQNNLLSQLMNVLVWKFAYFWPVHLITSIVSCHLSLENDNEQLFYVPFAAQSWHL